MRRRRRMRPSSRSPRSSSCGTCGTRDRTACLAGPTRNWSTTPRIRWGSIKSDPAAQDDVITLNEITVPFGRAVHVLLHSKDVIHSFFLPHFRVKQDAVPGMTPAVVFFPTQTGTFEIACAELCGLAHYRMRGTFNVVSQKEFTEWLRKQ